MIYEELLSPFPSVPFEEMKKRQVDQYFNWFIETKEDRIKNLQSYIQAEDSNMVLDRSPESLISLWDWYQGHIEWQDKTEEELEEELQGRPEWMRPHVLEHTKKMSTQTIIIAYDISVYFGETMIHNNSQIYWGYLMKPKKLHGVNRPRLMGFAGDMTAYPYGLVDVCIRRSSRNLNKNELYETYQIWCNNI